MNFSAAGILCLALSPGLFPVCIVPISYPLTSRFIILCSKRMDWWKNRTPIKQNTIPAFDIYTPKLSQGILDTIDLAVIARGTGVYINQTRRWEFRSTACSGRKSRIHFWSGNESAFCNPLRLQWYGMVFHMTYNPDSRLYEMPSANHKHSSVIHETPHQEVSMIAELKARYNTNK